MSLPFNAAFLVELEKLARTRAATEWAAAQARGDTAGANQIASGYGQLGLRPRYLKDVSQGGAEAGVDLMMGAPKGQQLPGGYVARKMYKPDSLIHQGDVTRQVLEQKQRLTDEAKKLAPQHVVDMAGFDRVGKGPGAAKYVSYHEYVPKHQDVRQMAEQHGGYTRAAVTGPLDEMERNVLNPMAQRGLKLNDVMGPSRWGEGISAASTPTEFGVNRKINPGNVAFVPTANGGSQAKIMDFLPKIEGQPDLARNHIRQELNKNPFHTGVSRYDGPGGLKDLRKDVFKGQHSPRPKALMSTTRKSLGAASPGKLLLGGAGLVGGALVARHMMHRQNEAA